MASSRRTEFTKYRIRLIAYRRKSRYLPAKYFPVAKHVRSRFPSGCAADQRTLASLLVFASICISFRFSIATDERVEFLLIFAPAVVWLEVLARFDPPNQLWH